jgi:hypothetical protein
VGNNLAKDSIQGKKKSSLANYAGNNPMPSGAGKYACQSQRQMPYLGD